MSKVYKKVELSIPNQAKYTSSRKWYDSGNPSQDKVELEEYNRQIKLAKK